MTHRSRLRERLCRELAQAERDARLHTRREARRLGDTPPANALLAIAEHADRIEAELATIVGRRQPIGFRLGHAVASLFSGVRHLFVDRIIASERSYRATLLGVRHGIDVARLLERVALIENDMRLAWCCESMVIERECLFEEAELALAWFAEHPKLALRAGNAPRRLAQLTSA